MSTEFTSSDASFSTETLEPLRWLHFLPRWTLAVGLLSLALPVVFLFGIGQEPADAALGLAYVEILQAVRAPVMFRLGWALDALIWLLLGGTLLVLAGLLRGKAPILAIFLSACGLAQLFGAWGSLLRLDGISGLAAQFTGAPTAQRAQALASFLDLQRVIDAANHLGVLLQGIGFLLAARGLLAWKAFPRWLALWIALPGVLSIAQFSLFAAGLPYLRALNIIGLLAGNITLNFALTLSLWRPSSGLTADGSGRRPV